MKSKTKSNILIIVFVTLAAVGVIVAVLVTGFANSSAESGSSSSSDETSQFVPVEQPDDSESSSQVETSEESSDVSAASGDDDGIGQKIVASASALIGVPFVMNGESPDGFDNSGFIYYVLRDNGFITCPRTTEAQASMGTLISSDSLKPGDLVFFSNEIDGGVGFGGIYIGNGKMIASLMPGTNVNEIDITTEYYVSHFFGGVSLY